MFRFFSKKVTRDFTMDERTELIKDYLYRADDLAASFQYSRKPYMYGGVKNLDKFIDDLLVIQNRIRQLETADMIEKRTEMGKILDKL